MSAESSAVLAQGSVRKSIALATLLAVGCLAKAALAGVDAVKPPPAPTQPEDWRYWAFRPVTFPPVPSAPGPVRNEIDHFIFAELAKHHLTPSPEADRHTLIRRVYFDLVGLPPTPEEARAFQKDSRKDAYEKLVERLLASPQYGERWARHWLDVVRFAETHGFEMNQPRGNAWPYRDYVIRAFNDDKPYNQFVLEQLAGDALGIDEATGFLVAGPWDEVKSPDIVLTSNQRADELHDMVSTTGSAFLGLTIGCARCHNHKFDPIPQTDYYAIKACFAGVQHGERKLASREAEAREQKAALCRERISQLDLRLADYELLASIEQQDASAIATNKLLRPPVHPRRNVERFAPISARRVRFTITRTTDAEPCLDELEVYTAGEKPRNVALASAGATASASGVYTNSELHKLEHINDGKHGNSQSWISNERGKGWVELEFPHTVTIDKIIWGRDRQEKYSDRLALDYRIELAAESGERKLVASSADREPYVAGRKTQASSNSTGLGPKEKARVKELLAEWTRKEAELKELVDAGMVYAGKFSEPEPTYRFQRGDPMQKREEIAPGPLSALRVDFKADANERGAMKDRQRRLALAKWITDPGNPLTPRVMVNRLWQYHFGEGLVSTPSDFGVNGARPTNPELLDWLAAEFAKGGGLQPGVKVTMTNTHSWSLKHIHRLILNSAAYRQASTPRSDCLAVDAASRLLWRFPPRRLEAEAIRDTILAVSGKVNLRMGGPGFSLFAPNSNYVRVYEPKTEFGPEDWRRMIYGVAVRQRPEGVFGVFDCPDGGQIAPKRTRSTTPLQALNLMNSAFMMQQAGFLAERLAREAGASAAKQVQRAFWLAFNRKPAREELEAAARLVREQGLTLFCRALFNANEFVYVF